MGRLEDELADARRAREDAGLARTIEPLAPISGAGRGGRDAVDFVTNDYLGLARDATLIDAAAEAARSFGAGARAARLLGGGSPLDRAAERAVAEWLDAEDALLFPTGYQANVGLVPTLVERGDVVLSDQLAHASLIDGARLSRATVSVHRHVDLEHVAALLRAARGARRRLVLTEGIFSMDGSRPPLVELGELCVAHDARLVVDEAHAAGLVGPQGRGSWAAAVAAGAPPAALAARLVTGGKSLGVAGALVVGSRALRTELVDRARSFLFTTGVPPAVAGALVAAVARARAADDARRRTLALARSLAAALDLPTPAGAIVPVPVGDDRRAVQAAATLRSRGFEVRAVRPPTVPPGTARLRVVCHATNDEEEVRRLVAALCELDLPAAPAPAGGSTSGSTSGHAGAAARRALVVAGTDTGVGKTVVAAALARALARRGPVGYWKPVQTGAECDTAEVRRLTTDRGVRLHEPAFRFALPASPHEAAAHEDRSVEVAAIDRELDRLLELPEALVVELAGGLHVPWTESVLQSDWLARRRPDVVLVARSGLGTLNHTLLSLEALTRRGIVPRILVLVGERHVSNRRTLAARTGLPVVELPRLARIDPADLDAWPADGHGEGLREWLESPAGAALWPDGRAGETLTSPRREP